VSGCVLIRPAVFLGCYQLFAARAAAAAAEAAQHSAATVSVKRGAE
jgi:hypothetical protein